MPTSVVNDDPFIDSFTQLDLSSGPKHIADVTSDEPELQPEVVSNVEPEHVAPEVQEPEPTTFQMEDGSTFTIENTKKGWRAELNSGDGNPEVFYGATKDELLQNLAVGKINATRKIREQNRKLKLGAQPTRTETVQTPVTKAHEYTADEIFEIKAQLDADPTLAFKNWFQKETGMSVGDLTSLAKDGKSARNELYRENVGKEFIALNPDFHVCPDNAIAVYEWVAKYKLRKLFAGVATLDELVEAGLFTVENLTEAFEDLRESGLLEFPQQAAEDEPEVVIPPPVIKPTPVGQPNRRARGALGIRSGGAPPVLTPEPAPKNLEDMSDEQIASLMNGVRELRRKNPNFVQEQIEATRQRSAR